MVKESLSSLLHFNGMKTYLKRICLQKMKCEFANQWAANSYLPENFQIKENGEVVIQIRSREYKDTFVCSGTAIEGNKMKNLITTLRSNGNIPTNYIITSASIYQDFYWLNINPWRAVYSSGQKIRFIIEERQVKRKNHQKVGRTTLKATK